MNIVETVCKCGLVPIAIISGTRSFVIIRAAPLRLSHIVRADELQREIPFDGTGASQINSVHSKCVIISNCSLNDEYDKQLIL